MDVLILNRAEVEALLGLGELLDALRDGFCALTAGEVTAPGRNELTMPGEAFLLGMPGRLRDGAMTVKVVTVFESNRELPSHLAVLQYQNLPATRVRLRFCHRDKHLRELLAVGNEPGSETVREAS